MTKYIFNNDRNYKQGPNDLNEADLQNLWEKVEIKIERHKTKQRQKKSLKWLIFFLIFVVMITAIIVGFYLIRSMS